VSASAAKPRTRGSSLAAAMRVSGSASAQRRDQLGDRSRGGVECAERPHEVRPGTHAAIAQGGDAGPYLVLEVGGDRGDHPLGGVVEVIHQVKYRA